MAFVSAGVFSKEIDLSLYAEQLSSAILAIVGSFTKGPFTRTSISNVSQLIEVFGKPIDPRTADGLIACQQWFAAREFLRQGNQLFIGRIESSTNPATKGEGALVGATGTSKMTGTQGTADAGRAGSTAATYPANDAKEVRTLIVEAGLIGTGLLDQTAENKGVLAGDFLVVDTPAGTNTTRLRQANNGTYLISSVTDDNELVLDRDWPTGSRAGTGTLSAVGTAVTGVGTLFTEELDVGDYIRESATNETRRVASITDNLNLVLASAFTSDPGAGTTYIIESAMTFTIQPAMHRQLKATLADITITDADTITSATGTAFDTTEIGDIIVISGADTAGNNVARRVAAKTSTTVDTGTAGLTAADVNDGSIVVNVYSASAATPDTASPSQTKDDGATSIPATRTLTSTLSQFVTQGVEAGDLLIIEGGDDEGSYIIASLTETILTINEDWPTGSLATQSFRIYKATVKLAGSEKGSYINPITLRAQLSTADPNKFDVRLLEDGSTSPVEEYLNVDKANIEATINGISNLVATTDNAAVSAPMFTGTPIAGTLPGDVYTSAFTGGTDGIAAISSGDYIGVPATGAVEATGLQMFSNPEAVDINLLAIPGVITQAVQDEVIRLCEARADCFSVVDPPDFNASPPVQTVDEVLDWHNGQGSLGRTAALTSSYGTMAWTWQLMVSEFHDDFEFYSAPSGHVLAAIAFSDRKAEPWFAPAGLRRGKIRGSKGARFSPSLGDRERLMASGQSVNPIVDFVADGIHLYGQKTLLRTASALNRIGVRRGLLFIEKTIASASKTLPFEPNDDILFREFVGIVEPVFTDVLTKRGIREFLINDATTDADKDKNTTRYQMFLKPVKSAEIIGLEFVLTSQGADFTELISA